MSYKPRVFYDQLKIPDVRAKVACGPDHLAIGASAYGMGETPLNFLNWMRTHLGGENTVANGTSTSANQAAVRAFGGQVIDSTTWQTAAKMNDAGWQNSFLIHDNHNADPDRNGPYHHYIDNYAPGRYGNPWGGRDIGYPDSQVVPSIEYVFSFRWADPEPTPPTDSEEYFLSDNDKKQFTAYAVCQAYLSAFDTAPTGDWFTPAFQAALASGIYTWNNSFWSDPTVQAAYKSHTHAAGAGADTAVSVLPSIPEVAAAVEALQPIIDATPLVQTALAKVPMRVALERGLLGALGAAGAVFMASIGTHPSLRDAAVTAAGAFFSYLGTRVVIEGSVDTAKVVQ